MLPPIGHELGNMRVTKGLIAIAAAFAAFGFSLRPASATGTVIIAYADGGSKLYHNVRITVWNESMAITSADGQGTVVLGKASCTKVDELVRCLTYDATLFQNGGKLHIPLQSGTVWLNPTRDYQPLSHSSAEIPPRGVLLAVKTRRGTEVTMTGTVDEVRQ